jgi:hypothetical protein
LIYRLLGSDAEQSFARSWGVSYGLNAASEWKARRTRSQVRRVLALTHCLRALCVTEQDILIEALKGALLLAILERLVLTSNASWLEEHIDYMSLQARAACALSCALIG